MKRNYGIVAGVIVLLLGGLFFFSAADRTMASPPTIEWSVQKGTSAGEAAFSVAADQQGNVYIGGDTDGALYGTANGESDTFVAKYSPTGQLVWGKQFGTDKTEWLGRMAVDTNANVCLVGTTLGNLYATNAGEYDCFVTKLSSSGETLWRERWTAPSITDNHGQARPELRCMLGLCCLYAQG